MRIKFLPWSEAWSNCALCCGRWARITGCRISPVTDQKETRHEVAGRIRRAGGPDAATQGLSEARTAGLRRPGRDHQRRDGFQYERRVRPPKQALHVVVAAAWGGPWILEPAPHPGCPICWRP